MERTPRLESERLVLEPLSVDHTDELAPVLGDPALHEFTGGEPPRRTELREQLKRRVMGRSPDGRDGWLNWVLRERASGRVIGTLQATLKPRMIAELAWVIGTEHQGYGFAKEGAGVMADWLHQQGVTTLRAHIHPNHRASAAIARAIGLERTGTLVDGEVRWELAGGSARPAKTGSGPPGSA
jgi:RimJ/RimL family protein N-acetyltransferase